MFFSEPQQRPMNTYPAWKYVLVVIALVIGIFYALPNIYGEDFALQVSPKNQHAITQNVITQVKQTLEDKSISYKSIQLNDSGNILVRFDDNASQLKAKHAVGIALKDGYNAALNLAPKTPDWLAAINAKPMKLGLDLRGGIHFLLKVDMDVAIKNQEQQYVEDLKDELRKQKVRYSRIEQSKAGGLNLFFRTVEARDSANDILSSKFNELTSREAEQDKFFLIKVKISEARLKEIKSNAIKQNMSTLRERVNQLGVAEPQVYREGERIVVQLPGVQDSAEAKKILTSTASLEVRGVYQGGLQASANGRAPAGTTEFKWKDNRRPPVLLKNKVIIRGDRLSDASVGIDENGLPQVNIALDSKGGNQMSAFSKKNVGKLMAIVFIDFETIYEEVDGELRPKDKPVKRERVISMATIQTALGARFRITGIDSAAEAQELSILLRAGALIAPISIEEERTIGPSLGQENIDKGMLSVQVGLAAVLLFMLFYYRVFGFVADLALLLNLVLIVAIMSMLGATMTLPGIAGIVLTVGMAVDANVLIFERIREEIRDKVSIQKAIHNGYDSAFSTIMDANITTLIAAVILFAVGTGPIKGFAITLAIGIMTSMFTAIVGSRALINLIYGGKKLTKISI
jgi:preprotein translocase subunit SecD